MPRLSFRRSLLLLLATAILLVSLAPAADGGTAADRKLRVVVVGAHPDDPETGCGGLIASLAQADHEVIVGYLTCFRGTRKIGDEPEATVRRREAAAACSILGATPHFFDFAVEKLIADERTLETVARWLRAVQPDIVLTHWPLDTHPNHHVTASLVWQCHRRTRSWNLYFFEVMTERQTLGFRPNLYVDIAAVREPKQRACFSHASQSPGSLWKVHERMHRRRGAECGVAHAEAFVLFDPVRDRPLLPVAPLPPVGASESANTSAARPEK